MYDFNKSTNIIMRLILNDTVNVIKLWKICWFIIKRQS